MVALLNYLALIGTFMSVAFIMPALVGFGSGNPEIGFTILVYATLGGALSISILMAIRGRNASLGRISSIYLAVFSWVFFPLLIALPLKDILQISYLDAVFEAVSAFTTTAADSINNIESVPKAAIFFRASLQWIGGLATLLTFILFLGPIRAGGMPQPRTGILETTRQTTNTVNKIAINLFQVYLVLTIACFSLLMLCGVDSYSSSILSMTAITAGGYVPDGRALLDFVPPLALTFIAIFFVIAATSVFWHRMVMKGQYENLRQHRESYYVIGFVLVFFLVFLVVIGEVSGWRSLVGIEQLSSEAFFNAASLISTSGLQTRPGIFALISPALILVVLIIGGGCFSTAGGVKFFRLGGMMFHSGTELSKLVYPNGVPPNKFGSEVYSLHLMKSIWAMFAVAIMAIIIGANILALTGLDYQASMTASVAAFSNAGPAYSLEWVERGNKGWLAYSEMNNTQKLTLSGLMILGRLEVIAVIIALNPFYWLRR